MRISLIVAMSENGLIGTDQGLPWHLPADLKRFKNLTWGKPIVMGRKTHELIGRPLPGRLNIVITRQPGYGAEGCEVGHSFEEALTIARRTGGYTELGDAVEAINRGHVYHVSPLSNASDEVMIIGGAEIYRAALSKCERIYQTIVEGHFEGGAYFPGEWSPSEWQTVHEERIPADARNPHAHRFCVLERR